MISRVTFGRGEVYCGRFGYTLSMGHSRILTRPCRDIKLAGLQAQRLSKPASSNSYVPLQFISERDGFSGIVWAEERSCPGRCKTHQHWTLGRLCMDGSQCARNNPGTHDRGIGTRVREQGMKTLLVPPFHIVMRVPALHNFFQITCITTPQVYLRCASTRLEALRSNA